MFDTVILLSGPAERPVLAAALRGHRPDLAAIEIDSLEALLALDRDMLQRARLVAFASPVIVPQAVLGALGFGAINFHPGPPDYPGFSPAPFAIYDRATRFGATAHMMTARVDAGPIFDVELFDVPAASTVLALEIRSYQALAQLFWRNAERLAAEPELPEPLAMSWSGEKTTRAKLRAACSISPEISAEDLQRRLLAFAHNGHGVDFTVTLHGVTFTYLPDNGAGQG